MSSSRVPSTIGRTRFTSSARASVPSIESTATVYAIPVRATAPASPGAILICPVGGRRVAVLPVGAGRLAEGRGLLHGDGRAGEGDAVANGVYLCRVELDGPGGGLRRGMQRLVVMR